MGIVHSKAVTVSYCLQELPPAEQFVKLTKWIIGREDERSGDPVAQYALSELVAKGHQFCHRTDQWPAASVFMERQIGFEFTYDPAKYDDTPSSAWPRPPTIDLRTVATCELAQEDYEAIAVSSPFPEDFTAQKPCHTENIGRVHAGLNAFYFLVYVPKQRLDKRVLNVFLLCQGRVILKARCLIVSCWELEELHVMGAEETMAERTSRVQRLATELGERTFLGVYHPEHLQRALLLSQSVHESRCHYWLTFFGDQGKQSRGGGDGLALGYKYFAAVNANCKPLSANVLVVATDGLLADALAHDLSVRAQCDVYVGFPRGFRPSEGPPGVSDAPEAVWHDIGSLVRMIRRNGRPSRNLVCVGHFWGAAMLLKYAQWPLRDRTINGYALIAPDLGIHYFRADIKRHIREHPERTARLSRWRRLLWSVTGGCSGALGRAPGLRLRSDPLLQQLDAAFLDQVSLNTFHSWHLPHRHVAQYFEHLRHQRHVANLILVGERDEFMEVETLERLAGGNVKVLLGEDNLTAATASVPEIAAWLRQDPSFAVDGTSALQPEESQANSITLEINRPQRPRETFVLECLWHSSPDIILIITTTVSKTVIKEIEGTTAFRTAAHLDVAIRYLRLNNPSSQFILFANQVDELLVNELPCVEAIILEHEPVKPLGLPWFQRSDPKLHSKLQAFSRAKQLRVTRRRPLLKAKFDLHDYALEQMIGKGSFGTVWLACFHGSTEAGDNGDVQSTVAIKAIPKRRLQQSMQRTAVRSEIAVLKILSTRSSSAEDDNQGEDYFVRLYAYGQDGRFVYIVTEFVPGGELFVRLKRAGGRLGEQSVQRIVRQLAEALHRLHDQHRAVYRDLKPENILITKTGSVKLTDFGFASRLLADRERGNDNDEDGWVEGFCGSPYYIAPEMLTSARYTVAVDWWSLGVLAYELLTGEPPFRGSTPQDVYRAILLGSIDYAQLAGEAGDLIRGLLRADPAERLGYDQVIGHPWLQGVSKDANPFPPTSADNSLRNFVAFREEEQRSFKDDILCDTDKESYDMINLNDDD
jgi:serine/threonine protein kinase